MAWFEVDIFSKCVEVDLHDYSRMTAIQVAREKIKEAYEHGFRNVRLIHGASNIRHKEDGGSIKFALRSMLKSGGLNKWVEEKGSKNHRLKDESMILALRKNTLMKYSLSFHLSESLNAELSILCFYLSVWPSARQKPNEIISVLYTFFLIVETFKYSPKLMSIMKMFYRQMHKNGLIFLLLLLFAIFFNIPLTSASEGFTVMSVSRPDIISPREDLSDKWWLITISANGGGQSVVGTITPEELKQKTGGWGSKFPLTVGLTSKKEIVNYPLKIGENPVFTYDMGITSCSGFGCGWLEAAPPCGEGTYGVINIHRDSWPHGVVKRICIVKNQNGKTGYLDSPTTKFMADIELVVQNNNISKEISSDTQSIYFNPQAEASWQGSLVTGNEPPNSASFIPTLKRDSNRWKLVQISTLDEYRTKLSDTESFIGNNKDPGADIESDVRNKINDMNTITNKLLDEDATGFSASEGGFSYETTGKFITNPVITFRIRADWIGITIPFGIPKILSKDNTIQWNSNEKGLINLSIANIGDADGHFISSIENCKFNQSSVSSPIDVGPGDTISTTLTIDAGNIANNMTEQCSIRVYDINHPEYNDTVSYYLNVIKVVPSFPLIVDPVNITRNIGASSSTACRTVGLLTTLSSVFGYTIPGFIGSIISGVSQICNS